MFYSASNAELLDLGQVVRAQHAPDLSYIILFFRGGEMFTLRGDEALRCVDHFANRLIDNRDDRGADQLRTLLAGVRETLQTKREGAALAGAGRR